MATNRTQRIASTFSLKDVFVVICALLTALAPIVSNEVKFDSIQNQIDQLEEQQRENDYTIVRQEMIIIELKDKVKALESKSR